MNKIQLENIPEKLKLMPNWIVWKYETRTNKDGTKKPTKVPYDAKDRLGNTKAKSNEPDTWSSFAKALETLNSIPIFHGLGFCFPLDHSIYGVDFDDPNEQTETLVSKLNTYVERSPGGGYHAIALDGTKLAIDTQKWEAAEYGCNLEIYNNNARYFTFTGDVVKLQPISDCTEALKEIIASLKPKESSVSCMLAEPETTISPPPPAASSKPDISDKTYDECVTWARNTMRMIKPKGTEGDGSGRLISYCHAATKRGVKAPDAIKLVREMEEILPFPVQYTDSQIEKRFDDSFRAYGQIWKESNVPAVSEPAPIKMERKPLTYSLAKFPDRIQDFVSSISTTNDILPPILHLGAAYAIIGTLIGKRLWCDNKGSTVYPNYCAVGLAPTASNKTGTIKKCNAAMEEVALRSLVPNSTASALYDVLGTIIPKKEWQNLSKNDRELKKMEAMREAKADPNGHIILTDECTGVIRTILGGWDSKSPIRDADTLLSLLDSGGKLDNQRTGEGSRGMYDLCVGFLGFTQNETWNTELGGEEFMSRGLFGRFVPYTSTYLRLTDIAENQTNLTTIIRDLHDDAQTITERIQCVFGEKVPLGEKDFAGRAMDALESRDGVRQFVADYPQEWASLRNKILVHAEKCAMIDAFVNGDYKHDLATHKDILDCSKYFMNHALFITATYAAYFWQRPEVSAFGKLEDKVVQILKREGALTARELQRKCHFHNRPQLDEMMKSLVAAAIVRRSEITNKNGTKTEVFSTVTTTVTVTAKTTLNG